MPFHIYNSRDKFYKSKYGALKVDETVTFKLLLPQEYQGNEVTSARLVIMTDGAQYIRDFEFAKTNEVYAGSVVWTFDYETSRPNLYWYHFEFTAGGYNHYIFRGKYSTGYVDMPEEENWQLTVYSGEQIIADSWKGGIMYQIFPDRFYNSGSTKMTPKDRKIVRWRSMPQWKADENGIWNNDYLGGDLQGIKEKLDYIASLGVNIIYLNPIFEANSNHRYNTADYKKIDPLLGKEEDFIDLCTEAHKKGIKIILDGVFSHTGDDSIYFNKYGRYDEVGAYQSVDSPYYDWYKFDKWPNLYKSWWGVPILPEIEEKTPSYVDFITGPGGVIEKWLLLGADGWRLDVADELPDEFIEAIRRRMKAVKPEALLIGEVWEDASNKTSYCERRKYLFGKELDSVMNYPFRNAIIDFVANDNAEDFFEQILTITENYPKEIVDTLMNPLGTHDTVRILTRLAGYDCENMDREAQSKLIIDNKTREKATRLLKVAAVLQYTLPGFPSLYYGDEIGMVGGKDPFNRCGYPWYEPDDPELLFFFQKLGEMRRHNSLIFKDADFTPVSAADGCVCFERRLNGDENCSVIVIANRGDNTINYTLPDYIGETTTLFSADGVEVHEGLVILPPQGYAVLFNIKVMLRKHRPGSNV